MLKIEGNEIVTFHQMSFNPNNVSESCSASFTCESKITSAHQNALHFAFDTQTESSQNCIVILLLLATRQPKS